MPEHAAPTGSGVGTRLSVKDGKQIKTIPLSRSQATRTRPGRKGKTCVPVCTATCHLREGPWVQITLTGTHTCSCPCFAMRKVNLEVRGSGYPRWEEMEWRGRRGECPSLHVHDLHPMGYAFYVLLLKRRKAIELFLATVLLVKMSTLSL